MDLGNKKYIWPDFYFGENEISLGLESYVRKQNNKGVWCLIPVRMRYDKTNTWDNEQLIWVIKKFLDQCYKVQLLWKFSDTTVLVEPINGRRLTHEVDVNQMSETDRVKPYPMYLSNKEDVGTE